MVDNCGYPVGGLFGNNGFFLVLILVIIVVGFLPCGCENNNYCR